MEQSGAISNATSTFSKFVRGKGFQDEIFYKTVINRKGQTLDKLLRAISKDYSIFRGFAIHFNYNLNYQIIEMNHVEFETTRLALPDKEDRQIKRIALHPDWAKQDPDNKFDTKDIDFIHVFNPANVADEIIAAGGIENYKGQILWYSADGFGKYPQASFGPELESAQTDIEIKMFMFNGITTNFMASHLLITGKCETDKERTDFKENLGGFQGSRNPLKLLWVEKEDENEPIELIPVEIKDQDKMFKETEHSVNERIRKLYMIPPVLLEAKPGALGLSDETRDAVEFYNEWTGDDRMVMTETFSEICKYHSNQSLNPTGNYEIIPLGAEDLEGEDAGTKEAQNNLRGSVGGVTGIVSLLTGVGKGEISKQAAKITLMKLYGYTEEEANQTLA